MLCLLFTSALYTPFRLIYLFILNQTVVYFSHDHPPMETIKPKLRGRFHQVAFYLTLSTTALYLICWGMSKGDTGIVIYLLSQLILFGVSAKYHTTMWKNPRVERIFQLLDHISIFILISGTQTSVVLTLLPSSRYTKYLLTLTWSITLGGILKIVLLQRLDHVFDLCVYMLHGVSVIPFFKILIDNLSTLDLILFIAGGAIYLAGGLVFGYQRPDPIPTVFGYHEVFHVFTIVANYCFFVPILKNYVMSLRLPAL